MPSNIHPRGQRGAFQFEVRPNIFNPNPMDEVIERHGQYVRWLKSRPCPNRSFDGSHPTGCHICRGRGELYEYPREAWVYFERSPHGEKHPQTCDPDQVVTWRRPIKNVGRIARISATEADSFYYTVKSFTDNEIRIEAPEGRCLPESWEPIYVDYSIDLWDYAEIEVTVPAGEVVIDTGIAMSVKEVRTNDLRISPSITDIVSLRCDDGKEISYRSYHGRFIFLSGSISESQSKTVQIKLFKTDPIKLFIEPIGPQFRNELGWDLATGDVMAVGSDSYEMGYGDVITALAQRNRVEEVIRHSGSGVDVLPYYELYDVDETIISESGDIYHRNVDYKLYEHNKIIWHGKKQPSKGEKYSVLSQERVTYRIKNRNPEVNANENKRLPKRLHLQRIERFDQADIHAGIRSDSDYRDQSDKYGEEDQDLTRYME